MITIPFNVPYISPNAVASVAASLQSGKLAGDGPETKLATSILSGMFNEADVLLTPSCTHALELAVRLIGVGAGDEVIVPSYTFTSTANAIVMAGGTPVFVDIEPSTQNIDIDQVDAAITSRTKAVFCINYAGVSPDLPKLADLCDSRSVLLLEDNAHGLGAKSHNRNLGTFAKLATQSFHETKNIQCGEGGCLVINDTHYLEKAEVLREKGTNRSRFFRGQVDKYTWVEAGSSWLLADPLAALLRSQLEYFAEIQEMRADVWNRYSVDLQAWSMNSGVIQMAVPDNCEQPFHMYYLIMKSLENRSDFINHLRERGVMAAFHYQPLHSSQAGTKYGRTLGELPHTQRAADCLVRLPLWAGMNRSETDQVVEAVTTFQPS